LDTDNISGTSTTPSSILSEGSHTWYIKAVNGSGNATSSASTRTINIISGYTTSRTWYVDNVLGDDSNSGTEAAPWKTLSKAASTAQAGNTVIIVKNDGVPYREILVPSKGDTTDGNIIFRGIDVNNKPEIWGSDNLSQDVASGWTSYGGGNADTYQKSVTTSAGVLMAGSATSTLSARTEGNSASSLGEGEWDWAGGILYYRLNSGENINTLHIEAGQRNSNDPRNQLYKSYINFIKIINPEWFVFENVAGLMSMKTEDGKLFSDEILNDFKEMGYNTTLNLISAKDFGVPQDRKRVIIIGNRLGINVPKLKPTTKDNPLTVRKAISDLEELESGEKSKNDIYHFSLHHAERHIEWLKNVPEGKSAHDFKPENGMTAKGYGTTYKRIWWDRPSPAITTCFSSISSQNNVHPSNTRALTIREAMRIQTFSDNFVLSGSFRDIRTQIGNAVPPKLAKEIAKQLLTYFNL